ncbi:MAG: hypothetical protein R2784_02100 [Saprospiraceae bacterium]
MKGVMPGLTGLSDSHGRNYLPDIQVIFVPILTVAKVLGALNYYYSQDAGQIEGMGLCRLYF